MKRNVNDSIGCIVNECKFHGKDTNYCTLEKIQITKHDSIANTTHCTDCGSFQKD